MSDGTASPGALTRAGAAALDRGAIGEALRALEGAVRAAPEDGAAWALLAEARRLGHHAEAALAAAEEAVGRAPRSAAALRQRGRARLALDRPGAAADIEEAARLAPASALAITDLAHLRIAEGRLDEAAGLVADALAREPRLAEALLDRAGIAARRGRFADALADAERAAALKGHLVDAWFLAAAAAEALGDIDRAADALEEALDRFPAHRKVRVNRANLRRRTGSAHAFADAGRLVALEPGAAASWITLGAVALHDGDPHASLAAYRLADRLAPDNPAVLYSLASVHEALGEAEAAVAVQRRAAEVDPEMPANWVKLSRLELAAGHVERAEAAAREAIRRGRRTPLAHEALGDALRAQGRIYDAVAAYRRVLDEAPDHARAHSRMLAAFQCRHGMTAAELRRFHEAWRESHATAAPLPARPARAAADDPVIGFLAPLRRSGPAATVLGPLLDALPPLAVPPVVLGDRDLAARFGDRCTAAAVEGLDDEAVAETIRRHGVDVLVDMGGHGDGGRPAVLALRPAPVQLAWWGYPGTTGLDTVDALLVTADLVPPGEEHAYVERIVRLPGAAAAFAPPTAPAAPPREGGGVSFGCVADPARVTPETVALWARIVAAVPGSDMTFASRRLADPYVADRFRRLFAKHGGHPARLVIATVDGADSIARLISRLDIVLDPQPASRFLGTWRALALGVPVVATTGATVASRGAAAILRPAGLGDLVAGSPEDLVAVATGLAADASRRRALRRALPERLAASPLCDAAGFAAGFLEAVRREWRAKTG